ncbi:MAG: alanine racemase [Alphaproteobacteria bacterium]|nr:alanine racemase [Alphaproteobacteria bacterium]
MPTLSSVSILNDLPNNETAPGRVIHNNYAQKFSSPDCYSLLTVDLKAIQQNYLYLCHRVKSSECAAVIKADAYGLGADTIALALYEVGCRSFFVAYSDEALSLRKTLSRCQQKSTIYVLNGPYLPGWSEFYHEHNLTPVLNTIDDIEERQHHAKRIGATLPTALHIDTGMNRLGLPWLDYQRLLTMNTVGIEWCLIMSHLSCADDSTHSTNFNQLRLTRTIRQDFPSVPFSLCNSGGIFLGSAYHYDLVRPGMALYGLNPTPEAPNPMIPCVGAYTRVLQVQDVRAGSAIGYGESVTATGPMRLATIAAGYADGVPWRLSNQNGYVMVNNKKALIVGRVSMDLVSVDVTEIPEVRPGDWVALINKDIPIDDWAGRSGMIGYELLLKLGKRFQKVYTQSKQKC